MLDYTRYLEEPFGYALDPGDPVDKLILNSTAFLEPFPTQQFLSAMITSYKRQLERFPAYAKATEHLIRAGKAKPPEAIEGIEDLEYIPAISVYALKVFEFESRVSDIILRLQSSGTSGYRSRIELNERSLRRVRKIAFNVYSSYGLTDLQKEYNYIGFTYDPAKARDIGTAFTDVLLTTFTKVNEVFWALRYDEDRGEFFFDLEGVLKALERFQRDLELNGRPLRILGFPAYLWFTLEEIERRYPKHRFRFGRDSYVLPGGGWKTLMHKEIPKPVFKAKLEEVLGIPSENVRDLYGMVEHGVPYVECEAGRFHVPIYSRVFAVDPRTGKRLPYNQPGLLKFFTPYIESYPSIAIVSTDLGIVRYDRCECGRETEYIELIGRAGKVNLKGCAIQALEFLENVMTQ